MTSCRRVQVEPTGFFLKIDTRHRAYGASSALAEGGSMPVPIPWTLRHRRNRWIGAAVAADRCHGAHTDRPPPYRDSVVKKPPRGPTAMAMGASYRGRYTRTAPAPPSLPRNKMHHAHHRRQHQRSIRTAVSLCFWNASNPKFTMEINRNSLITRLSFISVRAETPESGV